MKFAVFAFVILLFCSSSVGNEFIVQIDEDIGIFSVKYSPDLVYEIRSLESFSLPQTWKPEELALYILGSLFTSNSQSLITSDLFDIEGSVNVEDVLSNYYRLFGEASADDIEIRLLEKVIFRRDHEDKRYTSILFEIGNDLSTTRGDEFAIGFVQSEGQWKVSMPDDTVFFMQFFFDGERSCTELTKGEDGAQLYAPCSEGD